MTAQNAATNENVVPSGRDHPPRRGQIEDVGRGAVVFDTWLRNTSASFVTLERLKGVAATWPVGNIIALVDALGDIAILSRNKVPDPIDCATYGINLIGLVTSPAGEAPAAWPCGRCCSSCARRASRCWAMRRSNYGRPPQRRYRRQHRYFVSQAAGNLKAALADAATLGEQ
jgi:hypothetical protein